MKVHFLVLALLVLLSIITYMDRVCISVATRIVLWWSLFTVLTGFASGFYSLLVFRFLFGAGEPVPTQMPQGASAAGSRWPSAAVRWALCGEPVGSVEHLLPC